MDNQYHLVFHKENFRSGPYNSSLIEFMGKRFALMFSKYEEQSELPVNVDSSAEFLKFVFLWVTPHNGCFNLLQMLPKAQFWTH